jgi:hypothetical protein
VKSFTGDYRVHILIRRRGESVSDSTEIKTERYYDEEDVTEEATRFILDAINELEDGGDDDEGNESTVN